MAGMFWRTRIVRDCKDQDACVHFILLIQIHLAPPASLGIICEAACQQVTCAAVDLMGHGCAAAAWRLPQAAFALCLLIWRDVIALHLKPRFVCCWVRCCSAAGTCRVSSAAHVGMCCASDSTCDAAGHLNGIFRDPNRAQKNVWCVHPCMHRYCFLWHAWQIIPRRAGGVTPRTPCLH